VNFGKLPEEEELPEETEAEKQLKEKLKISISELELSVRSSNCLREARIKTIGDLVKKSELDMLQYRNFGKKSLAEIKKVIVDMGLSLGMKVESGKKTKEKPE
jgi:DNA-directed RNA polymerase subunit alpha